MRVGLVIAVLIASCCGCCCGRIPTFGMWPDLDEAAIRADLMTQPVVVDNVCTVEKHCEAVLDAKTGEMVAVGWNPFTDRVVAVVEIEAVCVTSADLHERAEPFVCAGMVGALGTASVGGVMHETMTEWAVLGLGPTGPRILAGEGSDLDWD